MSGRATVDWRVGDVIESRYKVQELVGRGGMGTVYRVRHRDWNQDLAVKVPLPDLVSDPVAKERFIREAHTWIDLGVHPNIVQCWFVREHAGVPILFLDFLAGGSLKEWRKDGKIPPDDWTLILDLVIQACDGLAHAHRHGVIHRDVKPANFLIRDDGRLCVTDFGLVKMTEVEEPPPIQVGDLEELVEKFEVSHQPRDDEPSCWTLTRTGAMLGTPEYAAPEQWMGSSVAIQADIYALGVLLFELCCGRRPFDDGKRKTAPHLLIARHLSSEPPSPRELNPEIPKRLETVILQCLAKNPRERPQNMSDLRERLVFVYKTVLGRSYPRAVPRPGVQRASALNNKAVSLWYLGKTQEAFSAWREASKLDALHPETVYNRSTLQWRLDQVDAGEVLRRLQQVKSAYPRAGVYLGFCHLEQMEPQLAEQELSQALMVPQVAQETMVWRALGDALMYQQRYPQAEEAYHAALERSPEDEETSLRRTMASENRRHHQGRILFPGREPSLTLERSSVSALAFGDQRRVLACASEDALELLNLESGEQLWRWQKSHMDGGGGSFRNLGFLAGGHLLCSLHTPSGRLWSTQSGRCLACLDERERFYASLEKGQKLVAGSTGLRLLRLPELEVETLFEGHEKRVTSAVVTPGERILLTTSWDQTVRLWNLATGNCLRILEGHADLVETVAVSPDGTLAVSGARDKTVRLWLLASGECLWRQETPGEVKGLSLTPDGRYLLVRWGRAGDSEGFDLRDFASGALLFSRPAAQAVLHPQGHFVAASGPFKEPCDLFLWEVPGGRMIRRLGRHAGGLTDLTVSWDGSLAASASVDGSVCLWEVDEMARVYQRDLVVNRSRSHAEAEETREVFWTHFSQAQDNFVQQEPGLAYQCLVEARSVFGYRRDPEALRLNAALLNLLPRSSVGAIWQLRTLAESITTTAVVCTSDGRLAVSGTGKFLRLWELSTGSCLRGFTGHSGTVRCLRLQKEGTVLSGSEDGTVRKWDLETGSCLETHELGAGAIDVLACDDPATLLVAGLAEGSVVLWNLDQQAVIDRFDLAVDSLALTPDAELVVLACQDLGLALWSRREGRLVKKPEDFRGEPSQATAVALSDDGRYALSGETDHSLRLWDLQRGRCVQKLLGHRDVVTEVGLLGSGAYAISGSRDNTVRLWDVPSGLCMAEFSGHEGSIEKIAYTPDGRFVVTAGADHTLRYWEVDWELDPGGAIPLLRDAFDERFLTRLTKLFRKR